MSAWESFLLDVLKIAAIVWLIGLALFAVVFGPRIYRELFR